jgi:tripartite-type tricarboxylate transporter receptor subunit TctC
MQDHKMNQGTRFRALATVVAAMLASSFSALAQYPNRPITVIVPFAAGGPTDVFTRMVGDHMSRTLGQQLIVENVAGAGGTTGMTRVATATPDGYTIGVGNMGTQSAAPALYPNLKYDPAKSFTQIGVVSFTPQTIVAKKSTAARSMQEFMQHLKASSGTLNYGHAGVGSISYVSGALFNHQFGYAPGLISYRGTGPAMNDLVAEHIDYMIDQSSNTIPQIQAGTIKAFAVAHATRIEALPNVPTTKELGVDYIFSAWNAMVGPADLPRDVTDKLVEALSRALDDPANKRRYVDLGSTAPEGGERGPAGMQRLVESEVARITPVLKAIAGVKSVERN